MGGIGVLMILVGGRAILDGRMTLGGFVMYVFFVGLVAAPLVQIASIGTQISEAFAGLDRIRELRRMTTEDADDASKHALGDGLRGAIAFEEVRFAYTPGVEVLRGVSFQAPAGSTTALVGSSGSGKSTLISLVMAFNRPAAGRILVDGHDLAGLTLRDYRGNLGVVLQDNFLFDGTIRENVAFARPDATEAQILEACRIARVDEFAERFDQQYDTLVGERGVKLSGGQRQRVSIARAILADPRILILDEATSALDTETEKEIQKALDNLVQGRTTDALPLLRWAQEPEHRPTGDPRPPAAAPESTGTDDPAFAEAVRLMGDRWEDLEYLGQALVQQGKPARAVLPLERAPALPPSRASPRVWLVQAYEAAGRPDRAREELAALRRLDPVAAGRLSVR